MRYGGIQKNSLIDFPGKISCVVFVQGCNFDCPYCHNPDLVRASDRMSSRPSPQELMDFLEHRREFLEGVVISGGEPTLHRGLAELCRNIRQMGFEVKLDTNGSRPGIIESLVGEGLVDFIAMDLKTDPDRYTEGIWTDGDPELIRASVRLVLESGVPHEFRTTCVKPFVTPETVKCMAALIEGAGRYALQQVQDTTRVLHPEYFEKEDRHCTRTELDSFKIIAEDYVNECIIRGA